MSYTLDEQQLTELENLLVMKIMKHFKDSYDYSPSSPPLDDVFYSPIGEAFFIAFHHHINRINSETVVSMFERAF